MGTVSIRERRGWEWRSVWMEATRAGKRRGHCQPARVGVAGLEGTGRGETGPVGRLLKPGIPEHSEVGRLGHQGVLCGVSPGPMNCGRLALTAGHPQLRPVEGGLLLVSGQKTELSTPVRTGWDSRGLPEWLQATGG